MCNVADRRFCRSAGLRHGLFKRLDCVWLYYSIMTDPPKTITSMRNQYTMLIPDSFLFPLFLSIIWDVYQNDTGERATPRHHSWCEWTPDPKFAKLSTMVWYESDRDKKWVFTRCMPDDDDSLRYWVDNWLSGRAATPNKAPTRNF